MKKVKMVGKMNKMNEIRFKVDKGRKIKKNEKLNE